ERKALVGRANAASQTKKKMTPQEASALFGKLQTNGAEGMKWITANKEWCSIPDSFAEGFKADHRVLVLSKSGKTEPKKGCRQAAGDLDRSDRARIRAGGGGGWAMR
ncbi:hypothetical protein MKK69_25020, partial [Methylobacterium sp. J-026]|nr:hypothetical protein [Methylobacterium sp. J-026]